MKMRNFFAAVALVIAAAATAQTSSFKDYSSYVNPMIGTDNHGHVAVGGSVPFGLVMMGPVQMGQGWDYCSGYCYGDSILIGFSPIHLSGTGCCDLGDILFMPTTGGVYKWRGRASERNSGHSSFFSHEREQTWPGYYSVMLDRWGIQAEMTATERVGWQRYTWPAGTTDQRILVDLHNSIEDRATDCEIAWVDDHTICGHRTSTGWAARHTVYFVAEFSKPIKEWRCFEDDREQPGKSLRSTNAYGELKFDYAGNDTVVVRLAISGASVEGAMANLRAEARPTDTFSSVCAAARDKWNKWMGLIDADFTNDADRTIFYTALYHMMMTPWLYTDANGEYAGSDGRVHKADGFKNYTTWSTWDTYRAFHPLATLFLPQMQRDWALSILAVNREQGFMPVWQFLGNETHTMVGISSVPILADMVLKGYVPEDKQEEAFQAMKHTMLMDFRELKWMKKLGYIPNSEHESVSKTMEYCLNDWSVAQVARKLGHTEDYEYFYNRSLGYKKLYDPKLRFMRSIDEQGNFLSAEGFAPNFQTRDYTEGNAWQYLWLAPHDAEGLVELLGGREAFVSKLDSLFTADSYTGEDAQSDIAGMVGQYAHGNEPSHHIAYLYNYAGRQDKTARILREIVYSQYGTDKDGLAGNEDMGQMSAWYILTAMGFYQVEPCGGRYQFGSPLVTKASFKTQQGKTFTIVAHNNSKDNIYIKKVKLNGRPYKKTYIDYADIVKGGTLEFFMGK